MAKTAQARTVKALSGLGLIGLGLVIASPADEGVVAAVTGGLGLAAAPIQGPLTGLLGASLATAGAGLLISAAKG